LRPIYVAAGSNVAPLENLRRALDELHRRYAPLRVSRAYRNPAFGFEGDDFVNLAVGFETTAPIEDVLASLHAAELACGRLRDAPKWAPRAMDLDVLLDGDTVAERPGLVVPRPDLLRRPYMLGPAAELAPDLLHPVVRRTLADLWREMQQRELPRLQPVELGWEPPGDAAVRR
jgi:2-amino-4-hydroxy-6-hydroxymethyldihydropteridine diphosphokinase